ncbi:MAG: phytanoyl-CoA dioxygenase (PhyH) family protein [Myxococcales bacterium]|nr:phytanoyl-CoA dioxygenase (PhyH) family protein [Myxococcales bacterium]
MVEADLEIFDRDGYVILENAIDAQQIAELTAAIAPHEADRPMGRNAFEGQKSQRVYSLAGKGAAFQKLAEHPRVIALIDRLLMPNYLLSTMQSIRLHPGEKPQAWHTDDAFYFAPRPHPLPLSVSVIWAIEDFTEANGATEVIPGSHRWGMEHPDHQDHDIHPAVMSAGSAIVFDAALWHRGGSNHSRGSRLAISPQYCQPWLRPQESQLLIVPPEAARSCSDRMRTMLGYSIHPPFIGQVDGMHPLRLVDSGYREHKTSDRVVADRVLVRPVANMIDPQLKQ